MEYTTIIIETADLITKGLAPLAIAGIASAIPGIAQGIGALFGKKRIQRNLDRAYNRREGSLQDFKNQKFTNTYQDQQNAFEDWQVNLRSARLQQQTASQIAAQGLATGSEIGMDPAAMAQMQENLLNKVNQQIQADVGKQEVTGQQMSAMGEMEKDKMIAEGEARFEDREMAKKSTLLSMDNIEYASALRAKDANNQAIIGGIGSVLSAGVSAFGPKLLGGGKPSLEDATSQDILRGHWKGHNSNVSAWGSGQSLLGSGPRLGSAFTGVPLLGMSNITPGGQFSQFLGSGGLNPLMGNKGVGNYFNTGRTKQWWED